MLSVKHTNEKKKLHGRKPTGLEKIEKKVYTDFNKP